MEANALKNCGVERSFRLSARGSRSTMEKIELAAIISGTTVSQFAIQAAMEKAERILADNELAQKHQEMKAKFFQVLDELY
ncbi:DUF1778 domain-containing protein [Leeia sp. TBRC 13508]|uniref:DUF1778 domain-containing protein n=1 Tax=Leeia speluncae TaxID=2884804 RepID=A0ABS8DAY7_9NEIS|nr:DUF1778 domain-containing protein [Leeia speluncae]MCB6185081.1 DUF1778 domain-containing protein [Leeia speluncae]